jgi:hypothetical protein
LTFNWKDGSKTVSLAELELAGSNGGKTGEMNGATAANVLNISDYRCSHLDDCAPPHRDKSEPQRSPIIPVGDGFGFVLFLPEND